VRAIHELPSLAVGGGYCDLLEFVQNHHFARHGFKMTNSATDIAIGGAEIAGLAAGCYAQMNSYRSPIFEMHHQPGGLCTAWQRQGFGFDSCIHYLCGSGQEQPFHRIWADLGVVPPQQFFHADRTKN
jgi:NAD(P)-binding Rossmann-like domain